MVEMHILPITFKKFLTNFLTDKMPTVYKHVGLSLVKNKQART